MTKTYDALIIGGGHNGLTCAYYLAKAGMRVRVLERRHIVGGAAVTEETIQAERKRLGLDKPLYVQFVDYMVGLTQLDLGKSLWTNQPVAKEIAGRLGGIFLRDEHGRRPVYGGCEKFQNDPYWRDLILFYEYFHGDNGAGLGASHQTGWTGLVAKTLHLFGSLDAVTALEGGKKSAFEGSKPARGITKSPS